jgi:adenine deaminase
MNAALKTLAVACALALSGTAMAQDLLVRNAKVHTATSRGTLEHADVLVHNGRIAAVGTNLQAGNATVVEANGRALTPALFGGITDIGLEEVSGESVTVDSQQSLGE